MQFEIGRGILTWNAIERRSGRYGSIWLMEDGKTSLSTTPATPQNLTVPDIEYPVRLIAEVLEPRVSTHVGDKFRGYTPSVPCIGEKIVLGEGFLETEDDGKETNVGVVPIDSDDLSLNPINLYRAHEQFVRLVCEPIVGFQDKRRMQKHTRVLRTECFQLSEWTTFFDPVVQQTCVQCTLKPKPIGEKSGKENTNRIF